MYKIPESAEQKALVMLPNRSFCAVKNKVKKVKYG